MMNMNMNMNMKMMEMEMEMKMKMKMESLGGLGVTIRRSGLEKIPIHVVEWTSECSCRASIAPAGWTSSGLRASSGGWAEGRWLLL